MSDDEGENAAPGRYRRGVRDGAFDREAAGRAPTDGLTWAAARHRLWMTRLLTIDDPRAANPAGFKGKLFPPQMTLLSGMVAIEARPLLAVEDARCPEAWAARVQTRMARVSAQFSFGKTVLSLALVLAQRVPARLPDLQPLVTLTGGGRNRANVACGRGAAAYDPAGQGFLPEVTVRYSRYLPLTVVAAAAAVISQWEENTRRFTDLQYFIIENVRSLREFQELYRSGEATNLDLVFVKAGRVTTSFVVEGEPPHAAGKAKNRSLFEALALILEGVPVARLIIDDYDTLKLGNDDCFVPALFTWLVSATRRQTTAKSSLCTGHPTVEEFFRANLALGFPIAAAALDDVLNNVFSLQCDPAYVAAHISSTVVGFRRIFVRGGQAAAILRDLEVPAEVIEMVNADAVGTAAQTLGIAAQSVGDVIHRVVGGHLEKLRHAVATLARVAAARAALAARRGRAADPEVAKALRAALKDGTDAEAAAALAAAAPGAEATAALRSLEEWAEDLREKHGKTLGRMRDNIREGQCQCCMVPFERGAEPAYVLAGCCQIIVCEPCISRQEGPGRRTFITRCPNCACDIRAATGLVRVGAELDLEAALNDETVLGAASTAGAPAGEDASPVLDILAANPKLRALIALLRGEPIDCISDVATRPYVEGLLEGRRDQPWPPGKPHKFLVFTMHSESTRLVERACVELGVRACVLRGCRAQKDEAVRALHEDVNVMLVTSAKDCGGLNLPILSHIVFYHRVLDRNVEAQVAARGQRLGREGNLEVVTLVNEAEAIGL